MRVLRRNCFKSFTFLIVLSLVVYAFYLHVILSNSKSNVGKRDNELQALRYIDNNNKYFPESQAVRSKTKVDWHNYTAINLELARTGRGEQGRAAPVLVQDRKRQKLWNMNGFDGLQSDAIALNRAIKDIRHDKCKTKLYNKVFPTVSVVIPFFEEHRSTLLRTVESVLNRSPPSVLKEIILVDDGSTITTFLGTPLDKWVQEHYEKVRIVRLPKRVGLIAARLAGAEAATGEVLVVLDSHCEVMIGWLPPLLDPIVENPRTAVCPMIDVINPETFAYSIQDNGARGGFDWRFYYKRLPLSKKDEMNLPDPFENPVMNGGLFAINLKFFWELGGYDKGITIWGGEQYNLSFKIWLCGGRLLDAPCSRVGHIFRHGGKDRPAAKNAGDFISINYKRVALAWMDEYIEALYRRNKHLRTVNAGDMSAELAVKRNLQCKSFSWYLTNVAPDLVKMYPPEEPPDFANGTIKSVEDPSLCIDTANKQSGPLVLYNCHGSGPQYFSLGFKKNIKIDNEQFCWRAPHSGGPELAHCQQTVETSSQWRYDPPTKTLMSRSKRECVKAIVDTKSVGLEPCNSLSKSQQWTFSYVNAAKIELEFPPY